jgi:hypothetical protein
VSRFAVIAAIAVVLAPAATAAERPADPRKHAEKILSERRFDETTPRPFRGVLEALSAPVREAGEALGRLVEAIADRLPGGERTFWILLGLLVCGTAAIIATRIARRRSTASVEHARRARRGEKLDPRRLEREADEAERNGDLERALRLRFRAGLLRLGLAETIPLRDSLTSGEVRRRLQRPEFDALAAAFDEIVYGGRRPEPADVEEARTGWPRLLKAVGAT